MKNSNFVLIAEGMYDSVEDAKHALIDPFIEEFVEEKGKFRIQDIDGIFAASGVSLGDLSIAMLEDGVFEISTKDSPQILTRRRAEQLVEKLNQFAMFDEIRIEPDEKQ